MPGKLSLALALLALISTAQAHSLEKRQTTVNLGDSNELYMLVLTAAIVTLVALAATSAFPLLLPTVQSISARHSHMGLLSNAVSSIDLVDTAFNYMDIEEESCRLKTVCEMEAYAVAHPLAKLAINTINSNLRGLDRYQDAIDAGMNGQDCAFLYDQCQFSYFGY